MAFGMTSLEFVPCFAIRSLQQYAKMFRDNCTYTFTACSIHLSRSAYTRQWNTQTIWVLVARHFSNGLNRSGRLQIVRVFTWPGTYSNRCLYLFDFFLSLTVSLWLSSGLLMGVEQNLEGKIGPTRHTLSFYISKPYFYATRWIRWSVFRPSLSQITCRFRNTLCKFWESCWKMGNGLWYSNVISRMK